MVVGRRRTYAETWDRSSRNPVPWRWEVKVAYVKFENPETQRAFEVVVEGEPDVFEVISRWRLFGERAIRGDLASLARLLRENEELLAGRRGRFAVLGETAEEKAELAASYKPLGDPWEHEE